MWVDEPAQGISDTFPEDSNYGLVDVDDEPYAELVETAARVNAAAHARHQTATISGDIAMSYEKGMLQLRNDSQWSAKGKLTALVGGKLTSSEVTVPAGQTVNLQGHDWSKAAYVLLEEWDGTITRVAPSAQTGPPAVINAGTQAVHEVPVIHDGNTVSAVWIKTIAPGQKMPLAAASKNSAKPSGHAGAVLVDTGYVNMHSPRAGPSIRDRRTAPGLRAVASGVVGSATTSQLLESPIPTQQRARSQGPAANPGTASESQTTGTSALRQEVGKKESL
jgi:hypothetical protein